MRSLYLLRSHGQVGLDGEQVVVRCGDEEVERVPLPQLDQILVHGNLQLSTPLIRACLERQISIGYFSQSGWCQGKLHPIEMGYRHRMRYQQLLSEPERMVAAVSLIRAKISNGRVLLLRLTRRQRREDVQPSIQRLAWLLKKVSAATTAERLRGLEGNAALEYQQALGVLLAENGFVVLGRHYRPPTSPFDALSSYGYGVLAHALQTRMELQGLDPYEGVLHVGSPRHAALVSDLMEPLRTLLVDPLNVWLIRTGRLQAHAGFDYREGGMYLDTASRRTWMTAWAAHMAEEVQVEQGRRGPRWNLLDQLVRAYVRFVYDPAKGLEVPGRR
ncbi:MAG: CRISPR-associated endonuclease Cas1 [Chitinophagaceae bacterium]|nr:CRISPR-associated endonuclease Cas1 [Chitinophagaceae bacterium]